MSCPSSASRAIRAISSWSEMTLDRSTRTLRPILATWISPDRIRLRRVAVDTPNAEPPPGWPRARAVRHDRLRPAARRPRCEGRRLPEADRAETLYQGQEFVDCRHEETASSAYAMTARRTPRALAIARARRGRTAARPQIALERAESRTSSCPGDLALGEAERERWNFTVAVRKKYIFRHLPPLRVLAFLGSLPLDRSFDVARSSSVPPVVFGI